MQDEANKTYVNVKIWIQDKQMILNVNRVNAASPTASIT